MNTHKSNMIRTGLAGWILVAVVAPTLVHGASFQDLGHLVPQGVSADGTVVVGEEAPQAFRWTAAGGLVNLGGLSPTDYTGAHGVSADGNVVVGDNSPYKAVRWSGGSIVQLPNLPGSYGGSAYAASPDGSIMVGVCNALDFTYNKIDQAVYWTSGGSVVGLGHLRPTATPRISQAKAVSADGAP